MFMVVVVCASIASKIKLWLADEPRIELINQTFTEQN